MTTQPEPARQANRAAAAQPVPRAALLLGKAAAREIGAMDRLSTLADAAFSVFSQWGEDGIIEWLVSHSPGVPESFIEFGVENYVESNTRFLLQNRNWRGLVMDSSAQNVVQIRADTLSWRYDLNAVGSFITRDNIERTIADAGFAGEIGLLSIDIDGNDYWVWEAIENVSPHFVIVEYNANFGDLQPVSVPYREDFARSKADPSWLYFGASVKAFEHLAERKGYVLLGSNLTGINLFFARADRAEALLGRIGDTTPRPSRVRESRNAAGQLSHVSGLNRTALIGHQPVVNVISNEVAPLSSLGELFSERWRGNIAGEPWL